MMIDEQERAERAAKWLESLAARFRSGEARPLAWEAVAEGTEGVSADGQFLAWETTGIVRLSIRFQKRTSGGGGK